MPLRYAANFASGYSNGNLTGQSSWGTNIIAPAATSLVVAGGILTTPTAVQSGNTVTDPLPTLKLFDNWNLGAVFTPRQTGTKTGFIALGMGRQELGHTVQGTIRLNTDGTTGNASFNYNTYAATQTVFTITRDVQHEMLFAKRGDWFFVYVDQVLAHKILTSDPDPYETEISDFTINIGQNSGGTGLPTFEIASAYIEQHDTFYPYMA